MNKITFKPELTSLSKWIECQYKSYPNIPPRQQKEEVALILSVGISTVYRWLRSGNVYIEELGSSESGDDHSIVVWHCGNVIN